MFIFYHALQIILLVPTNSVNYYRCAVWIGNCKPINLPTIDADILNRNHRLCSLHFEDKMYLNIEKTRLSNKAIPTIFKSKYKGSINLYFYRKTVFVLLDDSIVTEETSHHVDVPSESIDETQIESVIIDNPPTCSTPGMLIINK